MRRGSQIEEAKALARAPSAGATERGTDKGDKGQGGKSAFKGARLPTKGKFDSGKGGFPNKSLVLQGGKGETPMPAALRGGVPNDEQGEPLCFGFNLGQCKDAPLGGRCARGRHVCCHPGCFRKHPFSEHKHSGQAA